MRESTAYMQNYEGQWMHESPNPYTCSLYDSEKDVYELKVTESNPPDEEDYWAWWNNQEERFEFIAVIKEMVEICFPYALSEHEKSGDGKLCRVKLEVCRKVLKEELRK